MWYKNIAGRFFGLVTKHTCDRQTDGQTDGRTDRQNYDCQDRASIAASRGKNHTPLNSPRWTVMSARIGRRTGKPCKQGARRRGLCECHIGGEPSVQSCSGSQLSVGRGSAACCTAARRWPCFNVNDYATHRRLYAKNRVCDVRICNLCIEFRCLRRRSTQDRIGIASDRSAHTVALASGKFFWTSLFIA